MSSQFSVIKFFNLFEKEIAKINTYPITSDNLVIQQDAFKRLGAIETDEAFDNDAYDTFAELECSRKESDKNLRFALELKALYFVFHIGGQENVPLKTECCGLVTYQNIFCQTQRYVL